jgi:hypothetical protein
MLRKILDLFLNLFRDAADEDERPRPAGSELAEAPPASESTSTSTVPATILPPGIEVTHPDPEPEIEEPGGMTIGMWTGRASLANPERDVQLCLKNNIRRLDVIVNDHSGARKEREFGIFKESKIRRLVELAQVNNIDVHFMSWVMPHEAYIERAAEVLVPLCNDLGVSSLQWDAEEPWTRAEDPMDYEKAARHIADKFAMLDCEMGVNGIGYTPIKKFGPLHEVCDYVVPQCYSTRTSGMKPTTVVPKCVRRWHKVFGKKPMAVGLAAYKQDGIEGHTLESAMRSAFAGAEAIEGVDTVIYWSLSSVRRSSAVAKVIRELGAPSAVTDVGASPAITNA